MWFSLDAYQGHVFWEFHEVHDGSAGQWRRLTERLGGAGVPSLEEALRELQLEPVHQPLRAIFDGPAVAAVLDGIATGPDLDSLEARLAAFLAAVREATDVPGDPAAVARASRTRAEAAFAALTESLERPDRAALLVWVTMSRAGELATGADVAATSAAWYDELRLAPIVAAGLRGAGLDEGAAWEASALTRVLLRLPRPGDVKGRSTAARDAALLDRLLAVDEIRTAMGVNTWEGVEWLDRDRFAHALEWAARLDAIDTGRPPDDTVVTRLTAAAQTAGYDIARLRAALAPRRSVTTTGSPGRKRRTTKETP
jgi:hypothetical protein